MRGARRASGRRALQAAVRQGRADAAVPRARARAGARAGRSRKGQRHRDDLHVRRHHRRHLVARAVAAGARGDSAERHAAGRSPGASAGWESQDAAGRAAGLRPDRRPVDQQGRARSRRAAARERIDDRRAAADHAQREVLRKGRSAARDRHQPPVVHQDDGVPLGADRARPPAAVASRLHAGAVRELGERLERRLVHQPPAVFRRAVPAVVPDRQGRRRGLFAPDRAGRIAAADRSVDRRAGRVSRRSARSARTDSPAIPTSWTRGRPRR